MNTIIYQSLQFRVAPGSSLWEGPMRHSRRWLCLLVCMLVSIATVAQESVITGKVTDSADGRSIPGVNVLIKGTDLGTITDIDGNFRLAGVPAVIAADAEHPAHRKQSRRACHGQGGHGGCGYHGQQYHGHR